MRQIARGLKLAHDAGIVHRDLKPSNVFLARAGEENAVKILDFGVAKFGLPKGTGEGTESGELLGSPQYMSPEQARGGEIDSRSDLWSLALIAFVSLTGHHPFSGTHVGDILVRICTDDVPAASSLAPTLPKAIDVFFSRALCRSPDGRFASARALADELAAIAGVSSMLAGDETSYGMAHDVAREESPRAVVARAGPTLSIAPGSPKMAAPTGMADRDEVRGPSPTRRRAGRIALAATALVTAGGLLSWSAIGRSRPAGVGQPLGAEHSDALAIVATAPKATAIVDAAAVELAAAAPATPMSTTAGATPTPSASARAAGAAPSRRTSMPSGRRPRPAAASPAPVDPKFGLPVETSR